MKLFYSRGACSLSPHIVLRELGLPFSIEVVDLKTRRTASGEDYSTINPKGYVPALRLEDGQVLTEGPAIVQYLADRAPEKRLLPPAGSIERARAQEWLNFIGTEIHKQFSPLFNPALKDEYRAMLKEKITGRLGYVEQQLGDKPYLLGDDFTVADAYLFTVVRWSPSRGIDLQAWPKLSAYLERVRVRPAVRAALEAENVTP